MFAFHVWKFSRKRDPVRNKYCSVDSIRLLNKAIFGLGSLEFCQKMWNYMLNLVMLITHFYQNLKYLHFKCMSWCLIGKLKEMVNKESTFKIMHVLNIVVLITFYKCLKWAMIYLTNFTWFMEKFCLLLAFFWHFKSIFS